MQSIKSYRLNFTPFNYLFLLALIFILATCDQQTSQEKQMQSKIDSLQKELDNTYRPGLGEFMLGIQLHHAKLWYAAQNENWPLADFEVHEIRESLDDIREFCKDRPEIKAIGMIDQPIDSIANAIRQKNISQFKNSFVLLTNTCNNCHQATEHGFNVVTIPTNNPVVNQDFKPAQPVVK